MRFLKGHVVAEGAAQRREFGGLAAYDTVVDGEQFPAEQRHAVAVADQVVGVDDEHVLVGREGEQPQTQQWPRPGLEAARPFLGDP